MIVKHGAVIEALTAKYGCAIWEAQDGMLTPLTLMGEGHLRNAYGYVLKRRESFHQHAILSANVDRLLGDSMSAWMLDEEWEGHSLAREFAGAAYTLGLQQIKENLLALEAEAQRRGIVLEGEKGDGENVSGNRSGMGVQASGIGERIAGYCRGLASKIRVPHLDRRG